MSIQQNIQEHIDKFGHSVLGIFGTETTAPFTYTVGLTETHNHSELLVFCLSGQTAQPLLNQLAEKIKAGTVFKDGDIVSDLANLPFAMKRISNEQAAKYAFQALDRYEGTNYEPTFLQVVLPDADGLFPWDFGYAVSMKEAQPELWDTVH